MKKQQFIMHAWVNGRVVHACFKFIILTLIVGKKERKKLSHSNKHCGTTNIYIYKLGQGGSYSLLWHQWGHTFSDYVHADKRMTEPQKTLRSLGFINGHGWTYISSLSMRIANEDTGMSSDNLEEFLEEDGGFPFLPQSWQADINEESPISEWHAFLFGLLKKVESELNRTYLFVLGVYIFGIFLLPVVQRAIGSGTNRKDSTWRVIIRFSSRLIITHSLVIIIAFVGLDMVENSTWGKSIRNRKSYRIPVIDSDDPPPSTIPYKTDILFVPHYASDYLASYSRILEFAHPGNAYWREITYKYAPGYAILSTDLQKEFCGSLIDWVTIERRFLKQDEERFWTLVDDDEELAKFCHRQLTMSFNPMVESLLRQIDSLRSETKFGLFRETSMQARIIPEYIQIWERRLMSSVRSIEMDNKLQKAKNTFFMGIPSDLQRKSSSYSNASYRWAKVGYFPTKSLFRRNRSYPSMASRMEPEDGVWLQEGDRAVGLFRCDHESE